MRDNEALCRAAVSACVEGGQRHINGVVSKNIYIYIYIERYIDRYIDIYIYIYMNFGFGGIKRPF